MITKVFLVLCGAILFAQTISANCIGYGGSADLPKNVAVAQLASARNIIGAELAGAELASAKLAGVELAGSRLAGAGRGYGLGLPGSITPATSFAASNGGSFNVISSSPIAPSGVTVVSENTIEGPMEVVGKLPVIATVEVEGSFPSSGAAGATYSCGNGKVGISSESLAAAGVGTSLPLPGFAGVGYAGNLAQAELAGARYAENLARAELAGVGYAGNLARAELASAQLAGAEISAAKSLARPCANI